MIETGLKSMLISQEKGNRDELRTLQSIVINIGGTNNEKFETMAKTIQLLNRNLVKEELANMENLKTDNGLSECNGNILAVLGQMNFIEQLKEQMNNLKSVMAISK
jgi:hypothetical protein